MNRNLTIGDQVTLARLLGAGKTMVWSDNLAPIDVNVYPMGLVVDTSTVDRCVQELQSNTHISPVAAREIVLSVLGAATDIGRGRAEHSESQTGRDTTGASSGADHDSASDE